jgi:hypothetical protein
MANPAAADMVYDNSRPLPEAQDSRPFFHDLPAGFVSGNHILIAFGTLSHMLPVNSTDIAPTDSRSFHLYQNLTVARPGDRYVLENYRTVSREISPLHCSFHNYLQWYGFLFIGSITGAFDKHILKKPDKY